MLRLVALIPLLLSASLLRADIPGDPDMELDSCDSCGSIHVTTNMFTIPVNGSGGGYIIFQNLSGNDWVSVTVEDKNFLGMLSDVHCPQSDLFAFCTPSLTGTDLKIVFSGVGDTDINNNSLAGKAHGPDPDNDSDFFHGVLSGTDFAVDLNNDPTSKDTNGTGGWTGQTLSGTAGFAVPEPAALPLAAAVAGFFVWSTRRRRQTTRKSAA